MLLQICKSLLSGHRKTPDNGWQKRAIPIHIYKFLEASNPVSYHHRDLHCQEEIMGPPSVISPPMTAHGLRTAVQPHQTIIRPCCYLARTDNMTTLTFSVNQRNTHRNIFVLGLNMKHTVRHTYRHTRHIRYKCLQTPLTKLRAGLKSITVKTRANGWVFEDVSVSVISYITIY